MISHHSRHHLPPPLPHSFTGARARTLAPDPAAGDPDVEAGVRVPDRRLGPRRRGRRRRRGGRRVLPAAHAGGLRRLAVVHTFDCTV